MTEQEQAEAVERALTGCSQCSGGLADIQLRTEGGCCPLVTVWLCFSCATLQFETGDVIINGTEEVRPATRNQFQAYILDLMYLRANR